LLQGGPGLCCFNQVQGYQHPVKFRVQCFYRPSPACQRQSECRLEQLTFLPPQKRGIIILVVFSGILNEFIYTALLQGHLVKCECARSGSHRSSSRSSSLTRRHLLYSLKRVEHSLSSAEPVPLRYSGYMSEPRIGGREWTRHRLSLYHLRKHVSYRLATVST